MVPDRKTNRQIRAGFRLPALRVVSKPPPAMVDVYCFYNPERHAMRRLRLKNIWLYAGALMGLGVFLFLLDGIFPYRAVNMRIDRFQAVELAETFLKERGYDIDRYHVNVVMSGDMEAFVYLQQQFGYEAAVQMLRYKNRNGYDFYYRVIYFENLPRNAPQQQFHVLINGSGDIVGFDHVFPEQREWPRPDRAHLTREEALSIALAFLEKLDFNLEEFERDIFTTQRGEYRTDHIFRWRKRSQYNESYVQLTLRVQGDELGSYHIDFHLPDKDATEIRRFSGSIAFVNTVVSIFILCAVGIFSLGYFLKKYHEGEVEVRRGMILFAILWIGAILLAMIRFRSNAWGTSIGELSADGVALFIFLLLVLVIRPFLSLFGFTAWSVGEALGRQDHAQKFRAIDGLFHGKFGTIHLAWSILRGYCAGLTLLGITAVLFWLAIHYGNSITGITGYHGLITSSCPLFIPPLAAVTGSLLAEIIFRLFTNLSFFQFLKNRILSVLLSAVLWAFFVPSFWNINLDVYPIFHALTIWFLIGVFLGFVFWKYDFLTVLIANFTVMGVMQTVPLVTSASPVHMIHGIIALTFLALPMIFMFRGFVRKEHFVYKAELVPAHIRRITERVRMSKELEIARQVQMRLLPKTSPAIPGFDISGVCIPAKETGGDYFDFIDLGPDKLGIVIGDVSGKGVPAAIYMTLTKGIVQSHADSILSPADVLVKVNNLLYKTIDRDSFVSLFYAILDYKKKSIIYARAGHNPVLYYQKRTDRCHLLEPEGIALGLERGEVFRKVIRQKEVSLEAGDLMVFYTDGFTEAMNIHREEFGEERLVTLIRKYHDKTVDQLYHTIMRDIKHFVRDAPQHDDMTVVFVKGTGENCQKEKDGMQ